jgi:hypothetical protein
MLRAIFCAAGVLLTTAVGEAQSIAPDSLQCLPNEMNSSFSARVAPEVKGSERVRLYFRRLSPTGAFYWVEMNSTGGGSYWTVFPRPEQRDQQDLTDDWWEILKDRDWMKAEDRDRQWLDNWMESRDHEAAEYYVAATDASGQEVARSETLLVEVRAREECSVELNPFEAGQAANLTIGETTPLQAGKEVFHWLCDGIISRVNSEGILRGDGICRACVVAGWLPVTAAAGAVVAGVTIEEREPRRVSETQPRN